LFGLPGRNEEANPTSPVPHGQRGCAKVPPRFGKGEENFPGPLNVLQEGEKFFIEDGKTMVQRKASTNKTWLIRGNDRILVTGTGRNELQDADEIDIAELVKLQFVVR